MVTGRIHAQRSSMSPTSKSYVSIQLPLGGHSFSGAELEKIAPAESCNVVAILPTAKCVAVPQEVFKGEECEAYLAASGITLDSNECAVHSNTSHPVVAVMAIDKACHKLLTERYGKQISYTTPLLITPMPEQGSVLHLAEGVLYIRVANEGLRLAEVVAAANDGDILYFLEHTHRVFNIYNMYARAEGDTQRLMSICKKLFTNIVCE